MDLDEIRVQFEQRNIQRVKLGGFDLDGVLRGKVVSLEKFWSAAKKGFGFCDVIFGWDLHDRLYPFESVTGWSRGYPDAKARVDLTSLRYLATEPSTAAFVVDFETPEGKPHPACPRNVLKRAMARAEVAGYATYIGVELEFWIFREDHDSIRDKGYRELTPLTPGMFGYSWLRAGQQHALVDDIYDVMTEAGIQIEGLHTETGPGVWEVALAARDALRAADDAALFKVLLKQLLDRHGLCATFMAKWNADLPGSSGHIHQSLWDKDRKKNLFAPTSKGDVLSESARHYLGGQLALMPELTAVFSPLVNTYKRYVPGVWAPLNVSWGVENRTCAIRVIPGMSPEQTRLEYRQTAADLNPHLSIATCLGAGLWGLEHRTEAPTPCEGDATQDTSLQPLPMSLREATELFVAADGSRAVLGDAFVDHYAKTRQWEVHLHQRAVTDWELQRYFELA